MALSPGGTPPGAELGHPTMSPLSMCQWWFCTRLAALGQMSLRGVRTDPSQKLPRAKLQTSAKNHRDVFPSCRGDGCLTFLLTKKAKQPLS